MGGRGGFPHGWGSGLRGGPTGMPWQRLGLHDRLIQSMCAIIIVLPSLMAYTSCAGPTHGAGTHSIEGKKWQEKARHFAGDFWKHLALIVSKWDSSRTVHFRNRHQIFFRATRGRLGGRSIQHSKRYWLRFVSQAGCQNLRAFFRATWETSRRFSFEICYVERGQCCPPIYLTSAKQHAKKKRKLGLKWNSDTLLATLMLKKFVRLVLTCP